MSLHTWHVKQNCTALSLLGLFIERGKGRRSRSVAMTVGSFWHICTITIHVARPLPRSSVYTVSDLNAS